jgi:hypothetical protein
MKFLRSFTRAALVALGVALLASVAAAFRGGAPPRSRLTPTPLPREWRWEPKSLDVGFMYREPERPPLKAEDMIEDMYAKRRLSP